MSSLALEEIDRTKLILHQRSVVCQGKKDNCSLSVLLIFLTINFLPGGIF